MASLILAVYSPHTLPFFSDDTYRYVHYESAAKHKGWDRPLKYNMSEFRPVWAKVQELRERLSAESGHEVSALDVEKVAFVLAKEARKLEEHAEREKGSFWRTWETAELEPKRGPEGEEIEPGAVKRRKKEKKSISGAGGEAAAAAAAAAVAEVEGTESPLDPALGVSDGAGESVDPDADGSPNIDPNLDASLAADISQMSQVSTGPHSPGTALAQQLGENSNVVQMVDGPVSQGFEPPIAQMQMPEQMHDHHALDAALAQHLGGQTG